MTPFFMYKDVLSGCLFQTPTVGVLGESYVPAPMQAMSRDAYMDIGGRATQESKPSKSEATSPSFSFNLKPHSSEQFILFLV